MLKRLQTTLYKDGSAVLAVKGKLIKPSYHNRIKMHVCILFHDIRIINAEAHIWRHYVEPGLHQFDSAVCLDWCFRTHLPHSNVTWALLCAVPSLKLPLALLRPAAHNHERLCIFVRVCIGRSYSILFVFNMSVDKVNESVFSSYSSTARSLCIEYWVLRHSSSSVQIHVVIHSVLC